MKPENKIVSLFNNLFINFRQLNFIVKIERVVEKMNPAEKIIFSIFSVICIISGLTLLLRVHNTYLVEIPSFGGSFSEGLVGSPRFINPVLAISDTDKDLSSIIYSGLLKKDEAGFVNDLAESFELSEDGTVYHFILKENAKFHNGEKVTTDDVIFTILKILDPVIKSPLYSTWAGVSVEKINEREIKFSLSKPYQPFLEALTIGILPKSLWEEVSAEEFPFSKRNIEPIGSGPYKIDKIVRNGSEIPTQISLASFKDYIWGRPKIKLIDFKFYQNKEDLYKAYRDGSVESITNIDTETAKKVAGNQNLTKNTSLPRVFGVFFNQNLAPVFVHREVREALDIATPKQKIIDEVLFGFGKALNGPTPRELETDQEKLVGNVEKAIELLTKNGWTKNEEGFLTKKTKNDTVLLSFVITTSDAPDLKNTALILKEAWEKIGAKIDIKIFEAGDLSQNIIKGRKYDALLFGEVVREDGDLYPFWHSSLRNDPGLNISLYTNITVDKMLEEIQRGLPTEDNTTKKQIVIREIKKDIPAIFLFSPSLLYIKPAKVKNITLKEVSTSNERFVSIHKWFIETDKVWKIFTKI